MRWLALLFLVALVLAVFLLTFASPEGPARDEDPAAVRAPAANPVGALEEEAEAPRDVAAAPLATSPSADPVPASAARIEREAAPSATGRLVVEVTLAVDDSPARGVEVSAQLYAASGEMRLELEKGTTDGEGTCAFDIDAGRKVRGVGVGALAFAELDEVLQAGAERRVVLELPVGSFVAGVVVDDHGRPVLAAKVLVGGNGSLVGDVDAAGRFRIGPVSGRYHVQAAAAGYAALDIASGTAADDGSTRDDVVLHLSRQRTIEGVVLDEDGTPRMGLNVNAIPAQEPSDFSDPVSGMGRVEQGRSWISPSYDAITDSRGQFAIDDAPAQPVILHLIEASSGILWEGRHAPGDGPLEIRLASAAAFAGTVRDEEGRPVPDAHVGLFVWTGSSGREMTTRTEPSGRFSFNRIPQAGKGRVKVDSPHHAIHVVKPVEVREAGNPPLEIMLEAPRRIAGTVVDSAGRPVTGAAVAIEGDRLLTEEKEGTKYAFGERRMWEDEFGLDETRTDDEGRFAFERLYAGMFRVVALHPVETLLRADLQTVSGVEDLVLVLHDVRPVTATLQGTVVDAVSGAPIPRFSVRVMVPKSNTHMQGSMLAFEDGLGRFQIEALEPGDIQVSVVAETHAQVELPLRHYSAGIHELRFALVPAVSAGFRVVDQAGAAAFPAWISLLDSSGEALTIQLATGSWIRPKAAMEKDGSLRAIALPMQRLTAVVTSEATGDREFRFDVDLTRPPEGVIEFTIGGE